MVVGGSYQILTPLRLSERQQEVYRDQPPVRCLPAGRMIRLKCDSVHLNERRNDKRTEEIEEMERDREEEWRARKRKERKE